ncbi:2-dehydropantoate 2-reductase [Azospirillum palustre]|uniref:2-dehydropantoate 2-reductase n=1 Tax=Azospirillum palustre TaxID=2044885 RepID=A0A2B8BM57_9PROT|nr:2-dehydropantoate 2-reductase [Azospirillum palustre]PGH58628.1 2-dehydropantoate 2-reductase [Azospirillum palustre]
MTAPRICIFGAGAVGSHVAARLLHAGIPGVAVVARGPHLAAMREHGLTFRSNREEFRVALPVATDDPSTLPPQDIVVVTLKAPALPAAAGALARLLASDGVAVFLLNGIPWWWNYGLREGGLREGGGPLPLLDPDAALWRQVGPERALGGVVMSPNEIVEPGVVIHGAHSRFTIGEPDGGDSPRARGLVELFTGAGMPALLSTDIRTDIWRKLLVNAPGNPLAALTRLSAKDRAADPELAELGRRIADEVTDTARALGYDLTQHGDADDTMADSTVWAATRSETRPSMLQDVLLGRSTEVECLLGQVQAFARERSVPTPVIDIVLPILRGLDRSLRR